MSILGYYEVKDVTLQSVVGYVCVSFLLYGKYKAQHKVIYPNSFSNFHIYLFVHFNSDQKGTHTSLSPN